MDRQVIELLRTKDEEGIRLLQKQYANLLYYIVYPILQSKEETEECLSDIYFLVWDRFAQFDEGRGNLLPWLTAIARNTALNRLRKKTVEVRELQPDDGSCLSSEEEVLRREKKRLVKAALEKLPDRDRLLFYRKYYYLQPTKQIAAELGMTERAVEGRLYRLRKKLQKELGGEMNEGL